MAIGDERFYIHMSEQEMRLVGQVVAELYEHRVKNGGDFTTLETRVLHGLLNRFKQILQVANGDKEISTI